MPDWEKSMGKAQPRGFKAFVFSVPLPLKKYSTLLEKTMHAHRGGRRGRERRNERHEQQPQ